MIPEEEVLVTITNRGYIKRFRTRRIGSSIEAAVGSPG